MACRKCLYQLGDIEAARQSYESLLQVASYAQRAREALTALSGAPEVAPDGTPAANEPAGVLPPGTEAHVAKEAGDPSEPGSGSAAGTAPMHPSQASPQVPPSRRPPFPRRRGGAGSLSYADAGPVSAPNDATTSSLPPVKERSAN